MFLTTAHLDPPVATIRHSLEAASVRGLLWELTEPADQLQHVSIRMRPNRIDLGLYHLADTQQEAADAARRLCVRAFVSAPTLNGWRLRLATSGTQPFPTHPDRAGDN